MEKADTPGGLGGQGMDALRRNATSCHEVGVRTLVVDSLGGVGGVGTDALRRCSSFSVKHDPHTAEVAECVDDESLRLPRQCRVANRALVGDVCKTRPTCILIKVSFGPPHSGGCAFGITVCIDYAYYPESACYPETTCYPEST